MLFECDDLWLRNSTLNTQKYLLHLNHNHFNEIIESQKLKWDASSGWLSSLYCPMRNLDEMTIELTHPTLKILAVITRTAVSRIFVFLIKQNYTVVKIYLSRLNLFYHVLTKRKVVNSQRRYETDIISIC